MADAINKVGMVPRLSAGAGFMPRRSKFLDGTIKAFFMPGQTWGLASQGDEYSPPTEWPAAGMLLRMPTCVRFFYGQDEFDREGYPADNHQWADVKDEIAQAVEEEGRPSVYFESSELERGYLQPTDITYDLDEVEEWLGVRVYTAVVVTRPAPANVDIERWKENFAKFADFRAVVYVDTYSIEALGLDFGLENYLEDVRQLCDELADYGVIYGGVTSFQGASAEDFLGDILAFIRPGE